MKYTQDDYLSAASAQDLWIKMYCTHKVLYTGKSVMEQCGARKALFNHLWLRAVERLDPLEMTENIVCLAIQLGCEKAGL